MIADSSAIVVEGNFIGLDRTGVRPLANTGNGVTVSTSTGVVIGGTAAGAGNVISGNDQNGVSVVFQSVGTVVQGNLIGLDPTGTQPVINFGNGVSVDESTATTIGGTTTAARNIISANAGDGVKITNLSSVALVQGNLIGTDISGSIQLANIGNGVEVTNMAQGVTIGGTTAGARNIISGNQESGIVLSIGSGVGNSVQGNYVGTDVSGTRALGNMQYGVLISQSQANLIGGATPSSGNVISAEENVIASNHLAGVFILGKHATGNIIEGNLVGTDASGAHALGNAQGGVAIGSGATGNTIGGTTPAARNVISGNLTDGVTIAGAGTSGNMVEGNEIGTDASGLHSLGNFLRGIFIQDASNNTVGGTTLAAANLISGNGQDGIAINNADATGNVIEANAIGTNITTQGSLGNGGNGLSVIGAPLNAVKLNVISGNSGNGISIANLPAAPGQGIVVIANVIGSNLTNAALGNGGDGILLDNVTNEVIGGLAASDRNVVSANRLAGVEIEGAGSSANLVEGNDIGTTLSGTAPLGNAIGVNLNGAPGNTVAFNLISGNSLPQAGGIGVQVVGTSAAGNQVIGNFIGTDITGTHAVANDVGVSISGAPGNTIALNLISGNIRSDTSGIGIEISGTGASNNLVQSNKMGTNQAGTQTLASAQADLGILINDTPGNNTVGGTGAGEGNVISGFKVAIEIFAAQSQFNPTPGSIVQGNKIGTDLTGEVALGNAVGVYINGVPRNLIGGTVSGAGNIISGNTIGIYLLGSTTTGNLIQGNLIGLDAAGKVPLGNYIGVYLDAATANTIGGTTPAARNFIAGNRRNGPDGSTGVYLFDKALNNLIQNNYIGTTVTGRSGKGLGMGDYGVLLFNAPKNNVVRSGKMKNKIVGSGIAAFREFTGSTSRGRSAPLGTQAASLRRTHHTATGPQRLLRGAMAAAASVIMATLADSLRV
jgi:titin